MESATIVQLPAVPTAKVETNSSPTRKADAAGDKSATFQNALDKKLQSDPSGQVAKEDETETDSQTDKLNPSIPIQITVLSQWPILIAAQPLQTTPYVDQPQSCQNNSASAIQSVAGVANTAKSTQSGAAIQTQVLQNIYPAANEVKAATDSLTGASLAQGLTDNTAVSKQTAPVLSLQLNAVPTTQTTTQTATAEPVLNQFATISQPAALLPVEPQQNGQASIAANATNTTKVVAEQQPTDILPTPVIVPAGQPVETKPAAPTQLGQSLQNLQQESAPQIADAGVVQQPQTTQQATTPTSQLQTSQQETVISVEPSQISAGSQDSAGYQPDTDTASQQSSVLAGVTMSELPVQKTGENRFEIVQQPVVTDQHEIIAQVLDKARLYMRPAQNTEMVLQLRPEHLGELTLKVSVENGIVSAAFHSDNREVRQVIEASLPQLKQDLSQQGIKVDNVGVFSGSEQFFSKEQQQSFQQQPQTPVRKPVRDFSQSFETVETSLTAPADGVDYRI